MPLKLPLITALIAATSLSAVQAASDRLAVAQPLHVPAKPSARQPAKSKLSGSTTKTESKPAAKPESKAQKAQVKSEPEPGSGQDAAAAEPAAKPPNSEALAQACALYRSCPSPQTYAAVLQSFKQLLSGCARTPADSLLKANPALADLGLKAVDAGGGRIFVFTGAADPREVVVQWSENKTNVSYVGRRRRKRKVTVTTVYHLGSLVVPPSVALNQARLIGANTMVLVGLLNGSALWIETYKFNNGNWAKAASALDSIPAFLKDNVSGTVAFRGPDLIFHLGRVVPAAEEGSATSLPETRSLTYKFFLHLTDDGYALSQHLPDEEQFAPVRQFLDCLSQSHTDQAKALLTDGRLLSIPRYVGINGALPGYKVAQMASGRGGAPRFRVITGGKDDLIFEVAKVKGVPMIRAIFIAPVDPFLKEVTAQLPSIDRIAPPPVGDEEVDSQNN